MKIDPIESQELISAFQSLMPELTTPNNEPAWQSARTGAIEKLDPKIKDKLPGLFNPNDLLGEQKYLALYRGDTSAYDGDHSAADYAFVNYLHKKGLTRDEADLVLRSSKLYREKWDNRHGEGTYGDLTLSKVFKDAAPQKKPTPLAALAPPDQYIPIYHPGGLKAREFAGPEVTPGVRLFPLSGLSTLAGLGATGKTTVILSICAHIAAGKPWNGVPLTQRKTVVASIEETREELDRKFSAVVDDWDSNYREQAINNMRLIPLQGIDARLTNVTGRQINGTGWADQLIEFCDKFRLYEGVIVLDHLQGFASGDLNNSDTATAICREANKIAAKTGSAVVLLSHVAKASVGKISTEVDQGIVSGSLAFENAMRQTMALTKMSEKEALAYEVTEERNDFVWLGLPKNSYGNSEAGIWLKKTYSSKYHTITIGAANLSKPIKESIRTAQERLKDEIAAYIGKYPWTSRNALEKRSGKNGIFKASARDIRMAIEAGLEAQRFYLYRVTPSDRATNELTKQVKEVLRATH